MSRWYKRHYRWCECCSICRVFPSKLFVVTIVEIFSTDLNPVFHKGLTVISVRLHRKWWRAPPSAVQPGPCPPGPHRHPQAVRWAPHRPDWRGWASDASRGPCDWQGNLPSGPHPTPRDVLVSLLACGLHLLFMSLCEWCHENFWSPLKWFRYSLWRHVMSFVFNVAMYGLVFWMFKLSLN